MAVDELVRRYGAKQVTVKAGGKAQIFEGAVPGLGTVLLVKPLTYMNLSGEAVGPLLRYYKVDPESLVVIQDEVDLPFGRVRLKDGGGLAGHNGLKSLVKHLGTQGFKRVRLGVGRPLGRQDMASFVLSPFTSKESEEVAILIDRGADGAEAILRDGIVDAMNRMNALD